MKHTHHSRNAPGLLRTKRLKVHTDGPLHGFKETQRRAVHCASINPPVPLVPPRDYPLIPAAEHAQMVSLGKNDIRRGEIDSADFKTTLFACLQTMNITSLVILVKYFAFIKVTRYKAF